MADESKLRAALEIAVAEWLPLPHGEKKMDVAVAHRVVLIESAVDAVVAVLREWPDAEEVAVMLWGDRYRLEKRGA